MRRMSVLPILLSCAVGCSDEPRPTEILDSPTPKFSAVIDGTPWQVLAGNIVATAAPSGMFTVRAFDSTRTPAREFTLSLYNISKPGSYPIGMTASTVGGSVDIREGNAFWHTLPTGKSGTLVVTELSPTRLTGTFDFTFAVNGDPNSRTVTAGKFDVPITTSAPIVVPDSNGGFVSGTMGGVPWRAAITEAILYTDGTLTLEAGNFTHLMQIGIFKFTWAGTYPIGGPAGLAGTEVHTQRDDWGAYPDRSAGTLVMTSNSASRITGTVNVTVLPGPGSLPAGPLTFVGTFDVGLKFRRRGL